MTEIPESDRTLVLSSKLYLALEDWASEERKKTKEPLIKELITPLSLAQKLISVQCRKAGFLKEGKRG